MRIVTRLAWHLLLTAKLKKKTADFVPAPQVKDTPILVLECDADFAEHPVHLFTTPLSFSLSFLFPFLSHVYIFLHIHANDIEKKVPIYHMNFFSLSREAPHTYTYTQNACEFMLCTYTGGGR